MSGATIYIVDDDQAVRESLSWVLESAGYAVRVFGSAEDFLAAYRRGGIGCLVLDVAMPGMSGLELQHQMNGIDADLPVIFISAHGTVPTAVSAMRRGAVDFLMKPFNNHALLQRVEDALAISRAQHDLHAQHATIAARLHGLSEREREVLDEVVAGQTNKAIASKLSISIKTVETHRANIMDKTGCRSLAELVQLVVKAGSQA